MNQYDTLLLSAAHRGDLHAMQTCLLSLSNPNVYLNRAYDQSHGQKCTLLMIACLNGYGKMVYMILEKFKPNLEVLNTVRIKNRDKKVEIYHDLTVLWAATALGLFPIVKRLVELGAHINHRTNTRATSLSCACSIGNLEMVRYLVEHGANIRVSKDNHQTNLLLSVSCKHLPVCIYLVDELDCDVNECDDDGYSALYFAVQSQSLQIVQFLLSRGARNTCPRNGHMSPLMLAAEQRCRHLLDELSPHCSLREQIEGEELFASTFACAEQGPCDLEQFYKHYRRTLELRSIHNLPKIVEEYNSDAFNQRRECQTIDELETIHYKSEDMYIEALIIRERLLGTYSHEYHSSVIYRGSILANNRQYDKAITLWMYELTLNQRHGIPITPEDTRQFWALFITMMRDSVPIPINALLTVIAVTMTAIIHEPQRTDYNFCNLLFLITLASQPSVNERMSLTDRDTLYLHLRTFHQGGYITSDGGSTLLHLCLNDHTSPSHRIIDPICEYPCLNTVRTLLQCGAGVNTTDAKGNTPLHVFVSNTSDCNETILQLLFDAGAHFDCTNAAEKTPIDLAINVNTKRLLKSKMKISLKCSCARSIRKNRLPYHEKHHKSLVNFIDRH